jgi:hypothetical protein
MALHDSGFLQHDELKQKIGFGWHVFQLRFVCSSSTCFTAVIV